MAGPRFKKHLIHTAAVRRVTLTQSASGAMIESWATAGTIDCRYVQQSHRIADEGAGYPMVADHLLLCNQGEDVVEEDIIANVRFKSSSALVDAGPFSVESFLQRNSTKAHHISIKLERVE